MTTNTKQITVSSQILEEIKKKFGNDSIISIGEVLEDVESISTHSVNLDKALGIGGVPKGRITEIYGKEGSGKTTLCTHIVAEAQKKGELCAYIDMENAVSLENFENLGVNIHDNFILSQPNSGDEALAIVESLLATKKVGLIVVDSVASLIPQAELDGELQDSTIGLQARLMSKFMRRTSSLIRKSNCALIFINQLRANIGGYGAQPASTTTGGNALKYYASVRIDIARTGAIKEGEQIIGQTVKAKIVKNKVASPFKECEFYLIYGEGISEEREILELAVKKNIIKKGGAWLTYGDLKWQGLEKVRNYLKENPQVTDKLLEELRNI
jgi:recombination protein RecA